MSEALSKSKINSKSVQIECPHCSVLFNGPQNKGEVAIQKEPRSTQNEILVWWRCPSCEKASVVREFRKYEASSGRGLVVPEAKVTMAMQIFPVGISRAVSADVPPPIAQDFREASAIVDLSTRAAGMLARRSLQAMLRGQSNVNPGNLFNEIDEFVKGNALTSDLEDLLHHVRDLGNFCAHPSRTDPEQLVFDITKDEVIFVLDTIEALFDFLYIRPKKNQERLKKFSDKKASFEDA